jgi:hypothetical protein
MTNDKDSAVLADKSDEYAIGHLSALLEVELHENGHTIGEDLAEKLAEIAVKTVRQPTQSDAVLTKMNKWCKAVGVEWGQGSQTHNIARDAVDIVRAALQEQSK